MTRFAMLFVSAIALSACGGNICQQAAKDAEACGETVAESETEACEEALSSCSADEEKQLEDMYNCFQDKGLAECDDETATATGTTDMTQMLADIAECAAKASGVSAECGAGFGVGGGTTGTTTTTTTGS